MTLNFSSSALPTVTAREVANEFESHVRILRDTSQELTAEIQKIRTSREEIAEEYKGTAKAFIKTTLSELNGEGFDNFAKLAQGIPELGGQGLVFLRQKMLNARDAALAAVNDKMDVAVDVDGFKEAMRQASANRDNAQIAVTTARTASTTAQGEQTAWRKTTEYSFVKLNADIKAKGALPLTPENQAYYEPTNLFSAITNWFTRSESYRAVRKALVAYDNGEDGKNIFADMAKNNQKEQDVVTKVATSAAAVQTAETAEHVAAQRIAVFADQAGNIKSDDEILAALQDKAATYLETPEFMKAAADHYAEDFPTSLPLLSAKVATLAKLEEGAGKKMVSLMSSIQNATRQQKEAARHAPSTKVKLDLEGLRKENAARREGYSQYTSATRDGWRQTTTYQPSPSVVYADRSPGFFEMVMLHEILYGNQHRHSHDHATITTPTVSPYSADLFGVNKDNASTYNVPETAFDILPVEGKAVTKFDFDTAAPTAFDQQVSQAFDILPEAEPSRPYTSRDTSSSNFDILPSNSRNDDTPSYRSRDESPSFGGGSRS